MMILTSRKVVNTNVSELSWFMDESTAVIMKEKLALKSLDIVDETRAKWP